jgi:hypothetical protein
VCGPPTPATDAALPSNIQRSDMGSSNDVDANIRAMPVWPDPTSCPPLVTRIEHTLSCPEDSSPSPQASNGDASSLPTPAEGTSVAQVVAACNASATNDVVMPAFTPTSAEKAHYAMLLVLTLGQLLGKLGSAIYFTHGFDPGGAAPCTVPGPFELRYLLDTTQTEIWLANSPCSRKRCGWLSYLPGGSPLRPPPRPQIGRQAPPLHESVEILPSYTPASRRWPIQLSAVKHSSSPTLGAMCYFGGPAMGAVRCPLTSFVSGIPRNAALPLTGWRPRQAATPPRRSPRPEIVVSSTISSEYFSDVSICLAQVVAQEIRSRTPTVGQPMHYGSSFPTHKPHQPTR